MTGKCLESNELYEQLHVKKWTYKRELNINPDLSQQSDQAELLIWKAVHKGRLLGAIRAAQS